MVLYPTEAHKEIQERLQQQLTLPDELEAKTLFAASSTRMGKLDISIDILSAIEPAIQELPNPALRSYYYSVRGSYWRNRGDFPKAIDDHQQSLTLGEEAQSPYSVARAYGNLSYRRAQSLFSLLRGPRLRQPRRMLPTNGQTRQCHTGKLSIPGYVLPTEQDGSSGNTTRQPGYPTKQHRRI
jgi:tetratricopeptide (TPR) repeat protein